MIRVNRKMPDARRERFKKRRLIKQFDRRDFARFKRNIFGSQSETAQNVSAAANRNRAARRFRKFRFEIRFLQKRVPFEPPFVVVNKRENRFRRCGN